MIFYRYEEQRFTEEEKVVERTFHLLKETPCGWWIVIPRTSILQWGKPVKKWVSKTARKRYAYPTRKEAIRNFLARKRRQIAILKWRLEMVEEAQRLATRMMDKEKEEDR